MTETLRLTPLSQEECRARLEHKGKNPLRGLGCAMPPQDAALEEFNRLRSPLALKLCEEKHDNDVIEVNEDDDDPLPEVVRYAKRFGDGSIAAIVMLGRNYTTGIKLAAVSRALCEVSLTRSPSSTASSDGGEEKEVGMVDLATSPTWRTNIISATSGAGEIRGDDGSQEKVRPPGPTDDGDDMVAAAFLSMRKPPGQHGVFLDGNLVTEPYGRLVPLPHGCIISLYGPTGFAYEVAIIQKEKEESCMDAASASPKKRKSNSTTGNPHQELRQRAYKLMIGEFTCAMCMDILVKSTFAYPCMHAFCENCSHSVVTSVASSAAVPTRTNKGCCPTCRGKVEGWGAARSFDTIVWATALQGCFERDDAEYYLQRREECGEGAPTEVERECILNSAEEGSGVNKKSNVGTKRCLPPNPSLHQPARNAIQTLSPYFPTALSVNSSNVNNGSHVAPIRPPNLGKSVKEPICID